jgi:GNAT superfamily N-acetyltransferase
MKDTDALESDDIERGPKPRTARRHNEPVEQLQIRPALPSEADTISHLALRSKGHWGYDEAFLAACRDELATTAAECDGIQVQIAERDGTVVGYYKLTGSPPVGELEDLFVDPTAIGMGIGGQLLRHAIEVARTLELEVLTIDAEPNAETFYRHAGAVRVGNVPSRSIAGRELPRLELRLADQVRT